MLPEVAQAPYCGLINQVSRSRKRDPVRTIETNQLEYSFRAA